MSDKTRPGDVDQPGLPPEPDELEPAVRDIAYRLTHDASDTGQDLRDAVDFAPLAVAKGLNALITRASAYRGKFAVGLAVVAAVVGLIWRRRRAS